ncbi:hypothetical protein B0H17DRAFT_1183582 [Mycena rosella]|uniref:Uncharacterized protein n=1 Tax=Mycena rosella TaxID=1033263 RepID=A0AAD7CZE4_MYCRO|nr:hypothetical protein B0H17DRAFT_1183582 [Mycena rosella]
MPAATPDSPSISLHCPSAAAGVTLVFNLDGPGPFTLNINLTTGSINNSSLPVGSTRRSRRSAPATPYDRPPQRQFLRSNTSSVATLQLGSQDVAAAETPRSAMTGSSDTETDDVQSVAMFSPNNQLVTPSCKRLLPRMAPVLETTAAVTGEEIDESRQG